MDRYIKNKLATYFIAFEKCLNYNDYSFGEVVDLICKNFKIKTTFNFLELHKESWVSKQSAKIEIKKINSQLEKYLENNKNYSSPLLKRIEMVSEIYNLSEYEFKIMEFIILTKMGGVIEDLTDCLNNAGLYYKLKRILGVKDLLIDEIMSDLRRKGILSNDDSDELNPKILKLIFFKESKTKKQINTALLGKEQRTDLSNNDFIYFRKEQNIIESILTAAVKNKSKGINILLYGGVGTGKTQFAKLVAQNTKTQMFEVDYYSTEKEETSRALRINDLNSKKEILSRSDNTCILFDEAEDVMNQFTGSSKAYFNNLLENTPVPIIWTTNNIYDVDPAFLRRMTYTLEFRKLSEEERLAVWKNILKKNKFKVSKTKLEELNRDYDIPPSLISNAINATKLINGDEDNFETFVENVAKVVCKKKNVRKNNTNKDSMPVVLAYNEDLVNTDIDIKNLTEKIANNGKLNFSLCLYGEPGTGKSLYARHLANVLGLDVLLKRASEIISPYVGETEQNIADAFEEAKAKKAMLIFDEADTFLQNRNNAVRSWEVAQVNEMLTQMESHEYPFVCTTNLLETLDEASLRRFTFKIKFDFLSTNQVNKAFEHFFKIKEPKIDIKGLTAGDFATVKKKVDFLNIKDIDEITKMLEDEVKLKKSNKLKNKIGF